MKLVNIFKSYESGCNKITVFDGFSREIEDGAVTWITGDSGVGKTTLLRIIAGLEAFDGEIEGKSGRISFVFQEDRLFEHLTPLENCYLAADRAKRDEIRKALLAVGMPKTSLEMPAGQLSGGMKRRTAIVRALFAEADILLFDEPFKGLDDDAKRETAVLTEKMRAGRTLIAVTHDRSDMELLRGNEITLI